MVHVMAVFHTSRPVELPGMEYETSQWASVMVGFIIPAGKETNIKNDIMEACIIFYYSPSDCLLQMSYNVTQGEFNPLTTDYSRFDL